MGETFANCLNSTVVIPVAKIESASCFISKKNTSYYYLVPVGAVSTVILLRKILISSTETSSSPIAHEETLRQHTCNKTEDAVKKIKENK